VAGYWWLDPVLMDNEAMRKPKADKRTGAIPSNAVIRALEAPLCGPARPIDWKKIEAIQKEIAALPILDTRSIDEILGYDEFGLPS
jgi:hypothetical protein